MDTEPVAPPLTERPLRVLFLNWRDTGHPGGRGSEVYAEQVGRRAGRARPRGHAAHGSLPGLPGRPSAAAAERASSGRADGCPCLPASRVGRALRPGRRARTSSSRRRTACPTSRPCGRAGPLTSSSSTTSTASSGLSSSARLAARLGWWLESRRGAAGQPARPYVAGVRASPGASWPISASHPSGSGHPQRRRSPRCPTTWAGRRNRSCSCSVGWCRTSASRSRCVLMARLREEFPTARLVVAGRGWWEGEVRAEVDRLGPRRLRRPARLRHGRRAPPALRRQLGLARALHQGGLGPGRRRGGAARHADDRVPRHRRDHRVDRRRSDRVPRGAGRRRGLRAS